jgi:Spy/CpxP family protein refolding chaperone
MKKLYGYILAGSLALGAPLLALAQDQDTAPTDSAAATQAPTGSDHHPKGDWDHAHHGGWKPYDGFKEKYALTDDQSSKLKDLFKSHQEETKPLRNKIRVEIDTLRLDVDSNASESDLKDALDKLTEDKKSMQASEERFKGKLQAILTPKEQAQMILAMGGHHKGGQGDFGRHSMGNRGQMGMGHGFHSDKPDTHGDEAGSTSEQP